MSEKQRILPKWVALPKLHPGWEFSGYYRVPPSIIEWMEGAKWPETLPVEVEVDSAGRGRLLLKLRVAAQAQLPCQRCGGLLDWDAAIDQNIQLVAEEDPKLEVAQWVAEEERVVMEELIAQEISLALPDFPRHASCDLQ